MMESLKEIAQRLVPGYWKRAPWNAEYFDGVGFAEALISAYKAELLKEVGEPVAHMIEHKGKCMGFLPTKEQGTIPVFTSDQLAAAIAKVTKPLAEEIQRLQDEDNVPVRYYQPNGKGPVYAVYGSSSIDFVEELRNQITVSQEELRSRDDFIAMLQETQKDQLAKAEQLWQVAQGRCDGLEEKLAKAEQRVAEACALQVATETKFHWLDAARVAKEIRSGEWRKFMKGEWDEARNGRNTCNG